MTAATVSTPALPVASREADGQATLASLSAMADFAPLSARRDVQSLVHAVAGNSVYLARLLSRYPAQLAAHVDAGPDAALKAILKETRHITQSAASQSDLMRELRHLKARAALSIALADISGAWKLEQVTRALSHFAEIAVSGTLRFLLRMAAAKGELNLVTPEQPEKDTGIIVLGMGKLGAHELNYSSDIDLIVLFDMARLPYTGAKNPQHFMNRITQDLVNILQERTPEGYIFRTDLRLRPDPMSTPIAVTVMAALTYYETVGQNWERAAMIKARPIAGDLKAGAMFMRELVPYIWRKALDFATIADIHSIKRQMSVEPGSAITLPGHNVKTGIGGIREIEFFVQTQQLVWGGRIPELRVSGTLAALNILAEHAIVSAEARDALTPAYHYLRQLEHRLQMRDDAQTHSLPETANDMADIARFMGFSTVDAFNKQTRETLHAVHDFYLKSMEGDEPLAASGNLVFTGVEPDPETLKTLERMGYHETKRVSDIIQGWHRGHRRSTRSKRSRQVLTELVPAVLTALGKTANPDSAFFHFDEFLGRLPSGAQIFSLFSSRPELLSLVADILGSAPALGETLSNDPSLLDAVLETDFIANLPAKEELEQLLTDRLRYAHEYEQKMVYLRVFNNEKRFQAGVHLLKRLATPKRVGAFLSDLAEVILQSTMQVVWTEYAGNADMPATTPFAVLGLGKLGGREMTFGSDLDIVFIYDDAGEAASEMRTHVSRISQRLISALTLLTREGRLYEVDTRLRPGGSDGPLAASLAAFDAYFEKTAWTYEHMALTRARVVATNDAGFGDALAKAAERHVLKPRDPAILLKDVLDMRERIAKEFRTNNPWALKHVRGGMVDLDFIAQYLVLRHAPTHPAIWQRGARAVLENAQAMGVLDESTAAPLIAAKKFLSDLLSLLRLSAPGGVIQDDAPAGLKQLLAEGMRMESFESLKERVVALEADVTAGFAAMAAGKLG